jgi:hexokinase
MKKIIFFFFLLIAVNQLTKAQVKIGDNIASGVNSSSVLELESTTKGLLISRLTTAQVNAIVNPATGLLVYNMDLNLLQMNTGTPATPQWSSFAILLGTGANGAFVLPAGTNADRPATPVVGMLRYNTTSSKFEGYNGTTWAEL